MKMHCAMPCTLVMTGALSLLMNLSAWWFSWPAMDPKIVVICADSFPLPGKRAEKPFVHRTAAPFEGSSQNSILRVIYSRLEAKFDLCDFLLQNTT